MSERGTIISVSAIFILEQLAMNCEDCAPFWHELPIIYLDVVDPASERGRRISHYGWVRVKDSLMRRRDDNTMGGIENSIVARIPRHDRMLYDP